MKNIYINPNPKKYPGTYNNDDANFLQYIFKREPTKKQKILPVCRYLKAEDVCRAISAARFFLVGTDIYFMVTN